MTEAAQGLMLELGVSRRTANALVVSNFYTAREIVERCPTPEALLLVKHLGEKALAEIAVGLWARAVLLPVPIDKRLVEKIEARLTEIQADARYQSCLKSPAQVQINAPLALIQVSMKSEVATLRWVLGNMQR